MPLAAFRRVAIPTLLACSNPLPPMNRSGPDLLANALIVGYDVAKAASLGTGVDVNCFAGEHRTGCTVVTGRWLLGFSTPEHVMSPILQENPPRAILLRQSLTQRRKAFSGYSVLTATLDLS